MANIRIIKGNIAVGATLLAALVRRNGYDFLIKEHTPLRCVIQFLRGRLGSSEQCLELGESSFSMEDAVKAQLMSSGMYTKFPRNMLFSRALSNGVKWYCPEISIGGAPLYTPDELDEKLNEEGEDISDKTATGGTSATEMAEAARESKRGKAAKAETTKAGATETKTETKTDAAPANSKVTEMPKPKSEAAPQATEQATKTDAAPSDEAADREILKARIAKLASGLKASPEVRRAAMSRFWLSYFNIAKPDEIPQDAKLLIKAVDNLLVVLATPEDYEAFLSKTEAMAKIARENDGKPPVVREPVTEAPLAQAAAAGAGVSSETATGDVPSLFQAPAEPDAIDAMFPGIPAATKALVQKLSELRPNVTPDAVQKAMKYLGARDEQDYLQLHSIMQVILGTSVWQAALAYAKKNGILPKQLVDFIEKRTTKAFGDLSDDQIKAFVEVVLPNVDPKVIIASAGI
jgi:hypothetical protein